MSLFLGIDFGTSTNVVTCWKSEKKVAEPVPLGEYGSPNIFPNVIYYESVSNKIVGDVAVERGKIDPDNAVFAIKRRLESPNFQQYIPALGRNVGSEEVTADIFSWIKENVERKFGGQTVDGVVISVPFAFQNRERKRIERAAKRAGLQVLGLIEEPVAAALSFGLIGQTERGRAEKILVFDLGGGTFDVTIFDFQKQSDRQFSIRVITTDGAKKLGGIDIDDMIVDKIVAKMNEQFADYSLDTRPSTVQENDVFKMRQLAIEFKESLSVEDFSSLLFTSNINDDFCLDEEVSRDDFDDWLKFFLTKIENVLDSALSDADLEPKNIDRIIMVGGTSNIPTINEKVRDYFGKEPEHVRDLTLMVGEGAGIYCGLKYVDKVLDCDISVGVSQTVGLKWRGRFLEMLPRNTLYGKSSDLQILSLPAGTKNISVPVVQGNRINNVKIGSVPISSETRQNLVDGKLGIKLNTDANNGTVGYELYRMISRNGQLEAENLLVADKAEEE